MEGAFSHAEELAGTLNEYLDTRVESVKLEVAEKTAVVSSKIITGMILAVVFIFVIGLGSIALSLVIGVWVGKTWVGFLIMAGIYLLIAFILWVQKAKLIQLPITNVLIKQFFSKADEEN